MQSLTAQEIRERFVQFFESKGHKHKPSASLIPQDPTLLLTIAGMVPFKPIFMGAQKPTDPRVVTIQKCVRTADLDNVGRTARHHTFFEMLGNFSFGDYFKAEVIPWAWEFLTAHLGLPAERLWVSVFREDDEAFAIWRDVVGVPEGRIVRMGEDDNFWAAGPTGPCGPCSEIYFDQGAALGDSGNPDAILGEDDARYLEIWNLVFMEFNRDEAGNLTPLPARNIDTGMGLERIASVLQGKPNNFETDLLFPTIQAVAARAGKPYGVSDSDDVSLKVVADHLRAGIFLIADGVVPSNEGRGYVLRRLIRRAYRNGRLLGIQDAFLKDLVPGVVAAYGKAYPALVERQGLVTETVAEEEKRFAATIDRGMALLEHALAGLGHGQGATLAGETAFELHDTYGFPLDLTVELAAEKGVAVDREGFEREMAAQRDRARTAREKAGITFTADATSAHASDFKGYEGTEAEASRVLEVLDFGGGKQGVVLAATPFYAESGGQVGDTGVLVRGEAPAGTVCETASERVPAADLVRVLDTRKSGKAIVHVVEAGHGLAAGDRVTPLVDAGRRAHTRRHHTATHLLHAALRQVLGGQVTQAGSLVSPDALRFDFTFARAMTPAEIEQVERLVNAQVLENTAVETAVQDLETARASGAMALFGEKYDAAVRVLTIGGFSKELCGGTHVERTGDIGLFKILAEGGIAAGVRRVEAVAGLKALDHVRELSGTVAALSERLKAPAGELVERFDRQAEALKAAEKQLKAAQGELAAAKALALVGSAREVGGVRYVAHAFEDLDGGGVRTAAERVLAELGGGVVCFVGLAGGKLAAVVNVSDDVAAKGLKAGDVLAAFMGEIGGRGSGKATFAQGGGGEAQKVPAAIDRFGALLGGLAARA